VWFLDINYAEEMFRMFRKVWSKAKVLGWYSTGPSILPNDLQIHRFIRQHLCPTPIFAVIDIDTSKKGLPVLAYVTIEPPGAPEEFCNVHTELTSLEAEDIGIEHLLRDLTDSTISTLSTRVGDRQHALETLHRKLGDIESYLLDVADGKLPVDQEILNQLQILTNILPRLHQIKSSAAMLVSTNDSELCNFVASVSRCVMAIYDVLVNRRRHAREVKALKEKREKEKADKEKAEKEKAEKEKADKEKGAAEASDKEKSATGSSEAKK